MKSRDLLVGVVALGIAVLSLGLIGAGGAGVVERGLSFYPPRPNVKFNVVHETQWNPVIDRIRVDRFHGEGYKAVAQISHESQFERLLYARLAQETGFDEICIDECLDNGSMIPAEFNEVKATVDVPLSYVGDGRIIQRGIDNGMAIPKVCYVELYREDYRENWTGLYQRSVHKVPVVNIADSQLWGYTHIDEICRFALTVSREVWVWGLNTGVPGWEDNVDRNWPIIEKYYGGGS